MLFCCIRYETARSCHLSVLRMNQSEQCAAKRVFGVVFIIIIIIITLFTVGLKYNSSNLN